MSEKTISETNYNKQTVTSPSGNASASTENSNIHSENAPASTENISQPTTVGSQENIKHSSNLDSSTLETSAFFHLI